MYNYKQITFLGRSGRGSETETSERLKGPAVFSPMIELRQEDGGDPELQQGQSPDPGRRQPHRVVTFASKVCFSGPPPQQTILICFLLLWLALENEGYIFQANSDLYWEVTFINFHNSIFTIHPTLTLTSLRYTFPTLTLASLHKLKRQY